MREGGLIIYKFTYNDCNISYLGCQQQILKARIHQHLYMSERPNLTLTNPSHSESNNQAKNSHIFFQLRTSNCQHCFFSNLSILETMHIHKIASIPPQATIYLLSCNNNKKIILKLILKAPTCGYLLLSEIPNFLIPHSHPLYFQA